MRKVSVLVIFSLGFVFACQSPATKNHRTGLIADHGVVVSAHPEASRIGKMILEEGGNAVDAAVATGFALAVCYPDAGNIGGGGFMVIRFREGHTAALDYREKAPLRAYEEMFQDAAGHVIPGLSLDSDLAVGVPGSVAGLLKALDKYGLLSLQQVIQPAIDLAEKGFPVTLKQAKRLNQYKEAFLRANRFVPAFVKDVPWKEGDTLVQTDLANALKMIRDHGRDGFYKGPVAKAFLDQIKQDNGWITQQDLDVYRAIWREPLMAVYKNYKVISMPPPSSGGVALIQLLNMVEPWPIGKWGWNTPESVHVMVAAEKRVYADRARFLGDPDFVDIPVTKLIDKDYCRERMRGFSLKRVIPSDSISHGKPIGYESRETTHYSVVDGEGNAVAVTTTLNRSYGNKVVVKDAGFLLNNEMDDFSAKPGTPNSYGLIGGRANAIEPAKRMLSSMTPTILEKDGQLFMVVGSPGGSTIITSVFQTVLNVTEHHMTMQEAVNAGRFHHQWKPDMIFYEKSALDRLTKDRLKQMGYALKLRSSIGRVDAVRVWPDGKREGGADPRGDDTATGF
ncbi:MAG: gamma-glutamyltransferase [Bacteroidales bacterium]|nr:gamma-glutamyltransferase [Bacteroidales bacterium]